MTTASDTGRVALRDITPANRAEIEALVVTPAQEAFVASVADSLIEAAETPRACPWYRAIYADETPVGFVMISDNIPMGRPEYIGPYFLWRLLIDVRYQRLGYGRAALDLIVEYVRTRPGADRLYASHVPGDGGPLGFYLKYGFVPTGDEFEGEPILELLLDPAIGGSAATSGSRPVADRDR
jgi:diamine N-acetyltransferase